MSTPTTTPVNHAVKRDCGHSNNSMNSMQTHAHQKHGSASSNGSSRNSTTAESTGRLSFSQRAAQLARAPTPLLVKGDHHLLRDIDRPPPGDPSTRRKSVATDLAVESMAASLTAGGRGDSHLARKRSQYFEDAFATRRGDTDANPAKERVRSEALVLAEVRTNIIVGDEFTVVTELSAHLALRYRRPLSSVVVTLQHGACMCFGGSFAPAYVMAVYGLPSQLQPATNKRNAALIQRHMEETLGVPPARGHLRFVEVPEANLGYGGTTALGHVDELTRSVEGTQLAHGTAGLRPPIGSVTSLATTTNTNLTSGLGSRKYKTARKLSVKSLSSFRSPSPSPPELTPPPSAVDEHPPAPQLPAIPEKEDVNEKKAKPKVSVTEGRTKKSSLAEESKNKPKLLSGVQAVSELKTPPDSPGAASTIGRQPSRRARRTKSFVATLFGRSSTPKPEGGSP
ncbi:hypothetical protein Sste5344_004916 [Sporothrix stenoceras]